MNTTPKRLIDFVEDLSKITRKDTLSDGKVGLQEIQTELRNLTTGQEQARSRGPKITGLGDINKSLLEIRNAISGKTCPSQKDFTLLMQVFSYVQMLLLLQTSLQRKEWVREWENFRQNLKNLIIWQEADGIVRSSKDDQLADKWNACFTERTQPNQQKIIDLYRAIVIYCSLRPLRIERQESLEAIALQPPPPEPFPPSEGLPEPFPHSEVLEEQLTEEILAQALPLLHEISQVEASLTQENLDVPNLDHLEKQLQALQTKLAEHTDLFTKELAMSASEPLQDNTTAVRYHRLIQLQKLRQLILQYFASK